MKVEQLEKDIDLILSERGEGMFFIKIATSQRVSRYTGKVGKEFFRIASTQISSISIEDIQEYIDDDDYALVKIS